MNEIARLAAGAVLVLATSLALILFWASGPKPLTLEPPPGLDSMSHVDGVLTRVDDDELVLGDRTFVIEEQDAPRFDLDHLRDHAADRLPVRISFERREGRPAARWATDAPSAPPSR